MARIPSMAGIAAAGRGGGAICGIACLVAVVMAVTLCVTGERDTGHRKNVRSGNQNSVLSYDSSRASTTSGYLESSFPRNQSSLYGGFKKLLSVIKSKIEESGKSKKPLRLNLAAYDEAYQQQESSERESSGAVWQRSIMMGEKCEPPTFSGLILYDEFGNQVVEFPGRSRLSS